MPRRIRFLPRDGPLAGRGEEALLRRGHGERPNDLHALIEEQLVLRHVHHDGLPQVLLGDLRSGQLDREHHRGGAIFHCLADPIDAQDGPEAPSLLRPLDLEPSGDHAEGRIANRLGNLMGHVVDEALDLTVRKEEPHREGLVDRLVRKAVVHARPQRRSTAGLHGLIDRLGNLSGQPQIGEGPGP